MRPEATLLNGLQDEECGVAHFDYECVSVLLLSGLAPGDDSAPVLKKHPATVLFLLLLFFKLAMTNKALLSPPLSPLRSQSTFEPGLEANSQRGALLRGRPTPLRAE